MFFHFKIGLENIIFELGISQENSLWYFQKDYNSNNQYSGQLKNNITKECKMQSFQGYDTYYYKIPQQEPVEKSSYTYKNQITKPFWRTEAAFELILLGGDTSNSVKWIQLQYLLTNQIENIAQSNQLSRQDKTDMFTCNTQKDSTLLKISMISEQSKDKFYSQEINLNFKPLGTYSPTQSVLVKFLQIYVDRCHHTCSSCTGPTIFDCVQCINGAELFQDQRYCKCKQGYYFDQDKCVPKCPDTQIFDKENNNCLSEQLKIIFKNKESNLSPIELICNDNICSIEGLTDQYFGNLEVLRLGFSLIGFGDASQPAEIEQLQSLKPISQLTTMICGEANSLFGQKSILGGQFITKGGSKIVLSFGLNYSLNKYVFLSNISFDNVLVEISLQYYTIDFLLGPTIRLNNEQIQYQIKEQKDGFICGISGSSDRIFIIKFQKTVKEREINLEIDSQLSPNSKEMYFGIRDFKLTLTLNKIPNCQNEQNGKCLTCDTGYYVSESLKSCIKCGFLCNECKNSRNECVSCFNQFYLHEELKTCIYKCSSDLYKIVAGKCKCLYSFSIEENKCVDKCPDGMFNDNGFCKKCSDGCELCSSQNNCSKCQSGRYLYLQSCVNKCPNGYSNENNQTCSECIFPRLCFNCHPSCKTCNNNSLDKESCTSCYNSRKLTNETCDCRQNNDNRYIYYECNDSSSALLEISLSSINPQMIINFGEDLSFIKNDNTKEFCESIFLPTTINIVGSDSLCKLDQVDTKKIVVTLSKKQCKILNTYFKFFLNIIVKSQVIHGSIIKLKENIFSFKRDSSKKIEKYYNQIAKQDKLTEISDVLFKYDQIINKCRPIIIQLDKIKGDSQRGFLQFSWSVKVNNNNNEILQKLSKIIIDSNNNKQIDLTIPAGIVPPDITVTFVFDYTFLNKATGQKEIEISIVSKKDIFIDQQQLIPNPYFIYQPIDVLFLYHIETCNQNLEIVTIQEPVNIKIVSDKKPALLMEKHLKDEQEFQYHIDSYALEPNSITILKVMVSLESNSLFSATKEVIINSGQAELVVRSEGSNRIQDYRQKLVISGYARDLDLLDESQDQGITLNWSCYDFVKKSPCVNQKGETVVFMQGSSEATIQASTFEPYLSLLFKIEGIKGNRKNSDSVVVIFQELNIPNLIVRIQKQSIENNKVNLNDEIIATLEYDPTVNTDILSFSGAILYNDIVVGKIKFDYTKVRFQVWDYFSQFDSNQTKFQVRFSVYNPEYIMPSLSVQQFEINLPPRKCKFNVSPLKGIALETKFSFSLNNCEDEDQPIKYQFFYFSNEEQYKFEIKNPLLIQRKQISDILMKQFASGALPPGDLIVMALAIDSRNAIYNITEKIQVTKKDYKPNEYMVLLDSHLNEKQKTPQQNSYDLGLLSQDFANRDEFNSNKELNSKKLELVQKITEVQQQLPPSSTFTNLINKSIISLQQTVVEYNPQQQQKRIDSIEEQLSQLENLNFSKNNQNRETAKETLYDQFKILDSINIDKNNKQLQQKVIQISETIGKVLNKMSMPNEDKKEFKGNNFEVSSEKVTQKYLYEYFCCGTLKDLSQDSLKNKQTIYDLSISRFQQNPYLNDDSFQKYRNELQKNKTDLQLKNYEVILPSITTQDQKQVQFNSNLVSLFKVNKTEQNLACLTKSDNIWTKKGCQIIFQKQIERYQCQCSNISPTTLIEDFDDIFEGKNVQTAFGSQGLKNLQSFDDFYYYIAFWILLFKSLIVIGLVFYGMKLDAASQKDFNTLIKVNSVLPISNSNIEAKKRKKVLPDHLSSNQIKSFNFLEVVKTDQNELKIQNLEREENTYVDQIKLSNLPSSNTHDNSPPDQDKFKFNSIAKLMFNLEKKESSTPISQQLSSQNIRTESDKVFSSELEIKTDKQNNNKQNKLNNNKQKKSLTFKNISSFYTSEQYKLTKLPLIKQVILFHGFFNIFYVYNPNLSRAVRFVTFYIRLIHSLAISVLFNEKYSIVQIIILSVINGIVVQIFLTVFQKLSSIQRTKILSAIFTIIIAGGYYYIILSIVSGQSVSESNKFSLPYCIILGLDICFISSLFAILQRQIALTILHQRSQTGCQLKLAELLQLNTIIQNLSS